MTGSVRRFWPATTAFGVGTILPAGALVAGSSFREAAINDSGQVAGTARFVGGSPQTRGFIYTFQR